MTRKQIRPQPRGFTLLEVMIVVTVIGILAAVAIPNYTSYVQRGYRADAQATLMQAQQFMQRVYAANNSYLVNGAAPTLPQGLTQSPATGTARYLISIDANSTNAAQFKLDAKPQGSMQSDPCGTLSITSTGRKTVGGSGADATVDKCFK